MEEINPHGNQARQHAATGMNSTQSRSDGVKEGQKRTNDAAQANYNTHNAKNAAAMLQTTAQKVESSPQKQGVKGGLVLFWLVVGLAIGKDIFDIFTGLLHLIGLGLTATVIGAPIGVAIAFFASIINFLTGLVITFTMFAYFAYIGGSLGRRLVVMSIGAIIEVIPAVNLLPLTTAMFFLSYFIGKIKIIKTVTSIAGTGKKILRI